MTLGHPVTPSSARPATFAELYCAQTGCPPEKFSRRIFWRTLHWHAVPFAPLWWVGRYFEADRNLIQACGQASRSKDIREEIREFSYHPQNRSWLHRRAKFRVSTQRLSRLANSFLAENRPETASA